MADILFIKTSSLGDVIHNMPALTEARAQRPDARFAWVVEQDFAPLVRLHPAIDVVIPVGLRQWRRTPLQRQTWREIGGFAGELRSRRFDAIIDTQGLVKSALLARAAHGRRHGYDRHSITEQAASWFYDAQHRVIRAQHAVARNRKLTGRALGYVASGEPDYGLDRASLAGSGTRPYGLLLHATARPEKQWPEENWRALAADLSGEIDLVVPWGSAAEGERSARIAAGIGRARVPERQPINAMAQLIAGAAFVVGVDTGLLHLAAALGVPLVALFVATDPGLTGPVGRGPIAILSSAGTTPSPGDVRTALARVRAVRG